LLQNVNSGTTVTFRVVNWGGTSSSGTFYVYDVANSSASDFLIDGSIAAAVPEPFVYMLLGVGILLRGQRFCAANPPNDSPILFEKPHVFRRGLFVSWINFPAHFAKGIR
jgi:hypothetical protein